MTARGVLRSKWIAPAMVLLLATTAAAATIYRVDDGSAEASTGADAGGYLWFTNGFTAAGGADTITEVAIAFFQSNLPAGAPFTVHVYDDSDDDGKPTTGTLQLVASANATVSDPTNGTFQSIAIGPAPVSGGFFVAALIQHASGQLPEAYDTSASAGSSWLAASDFPINPANPVGTVSVIGRLDDFGRPGNLMIRARGLSGPVRAPALSLWALLGLAAVLSILGARSAARRSGRPLA